MASYGETSPYSKTRQENFHLGHFKIRPVPQEANDVLYKIEPQYTHRPDLLAYDLYDDPKLWWVFAQRNMDVIKDPIYDMLPGTQIYLPQGDKLRTMLGI